PGACDRLKPPDAACSLRRDGEDAGTKRRALFEELISMIVRHLDEIAGSEASVDTGDWLSHGLVLARDGKPYSLHDTYMRAGSQTLIDYPWHLETAYCIEGRGELENLTNDTRFDIVPGTVYSLESRNRIRLHAHTDLRLICVMTPPLAGGERLDKS